MKVEEWKGEQIQNLLRLWTIHKQHLLLKTRKLIKKEKYIKEIKFKKYGILGPPAPWGVVYTIL